MPKRTCDLSAPYQTIDATARLTGLSRDYLRRGVKAGRIPHIRAAEGANAPYMINVSLLLRQLEAESTASMGAEG